MKDILFSPYLEKYKAPLGALSISEECNLKIYINKNFIINNLELVLKEDENRVLDYIKCQFLNSNDLYNIYNVKFSLQEYYIYFYYFQFYDCYGKHYICQDKNMNGYLVDRLSDLFQINVYTPFDSKLLWFKGKIMYQIFVDRFYKGGKNPVKKSAIMHKNWNEEPNYLPVEGKILNNDFFGGDLQGIIKKLDYLKELNVSIIYLNPIFLSSSNHKYDTGDYLRIDPMFGNEEDLYSLCIEAKKRGIYIILDGVFNHTGADSIYFNINNNFNSLGAYQSKLSPYYSWYKFIEYPNKYECWWGIDTLPAVNQCNDDFMNFITSDNGVIAKWLKLGIMGYRLDVVDELDNRFVEKINVQIKKNGLENIIIGEVWEDASNKIAYGKRRTYFNGKQLDSVMNYPLKNAIIDYINYGSKGPLVNTINKMINNLPKHVLDSMMNLLSTHDTARIITVFSKTNFEKLSRKEQSEYRMSNDEYFTAKLRLKMATAILYTVPGVPCIYYGDELGVEGYKDPFCRRTMPWDKHDEELHNWYKKIGAIRDDEVFIDGKYEEFETNDDSVFAFYRKKLNQKFITIVNNGCKSYYYYLNEGTDMLNNNIITGTIKVLPFSVRIIKILE